MSVEADIGRRDRTNVHATRSRHRPALPDANPVTLQLGRPLHLGLAADIPYQRPILPGQLLAAGDMIDWHSRR